jgi:hypothetical protein
MNAGWDKLERISDDHWELVRTEKEALGYDREAYEHNLQLLKVFKDHTVFIPASGMDGEMMLLFRLGGLLDSAEKVKEIASLRTYQSNKMERVKWVTSSSV